MNVLQTILSRSSRRVKPSPTSGTSIAGCLKRTLPSCANGWPSSPSLSPLRP